MPVFYGLQLAFLCIVLLFADEVSRSEGLFPVSSRPRDLCLGGDSCATGPPDITHPGQMCSFRGHVTVNETVSTVFFTE